MELPHGSIIAAGPVIIEDGKVLLNKERKSYGVTPWLFPGGKVENFEESLEEACRREAKEEMGIDIEIIRPMKTILARQTSNPNAYNILVHYLARRIGNITPAENIAEWGWHDIDKLPQDCAENVYEIIEEYKKI